MRTKFFFYIFLVASFISAQENQEFNRLGEPYYPELILSENDSLSWPIEFDIAIDVRDIKGLEIGNESFFSKLIVSSYSKYDTIFITEAGYSQSLKHKEFFVLETKENALNSKKNNVAYYQNNTEKFSQLFYDDFYTKEVLLYEAPFDINWNLRNYPFDSQQLRFKFTTKVDTSIIKLKPSKNFTSTFSKKMDNLADGISVDSISHSYEYNTDKHDIITMSPGNYKPIVTETMVMTLNISRSGSWLFLKLFFGGILSYIISCFMFLLPITEELESKFAIALGAIFGAVGNKYFIASELSGVQVFTKADFVSNFIILMVVVNMLIMILQTSDKTFFDYLQKPKNALKFSSLIFLLGFLLIMVI